MKNLLNPKDLNGLIDRIQQLTPDLERQWGTMTVQQMVVHLSDALRDTLGDKPSEKHKLAVGKWPLNILVSQYLPWPKGTPTAPEYRQGAGGTTLTELKQDKQTLIELMHRVAGQPKNQSFEIHPAFGKLSNRQWGRLCWRHIDYHLRQFSS